MTMSYRVLVVLSLWLGLPWESIGQVVWHETLEATDGGFTVSGPPVWVWKQTRSLPTDGPPRREMVWRSEAPSIIEGSPDAYLLSPTLDLGGPTGFTPLLKWRQYIIGEEQEHSLHLEISADGGGTWKEAVIDPLLKGASGWQSRQVLLEPRFATSLFRFRFRLHSPESSRIPGIELDDFEIVKYKVTPFYRQDFELGDGGFTSSGSTSWTYGVPAITPPNSESNHRAWGNRLTGSYLPNENGHLLSPAIDCLASRDIGLLLSWNQTLVTEQDFDYATVSVSSNNGASWKVVYGPVSGEVCREWTAVSVLLSPGYASREFRVRFSFTSDGALQAPGFAIDDIAIARLGELPHLPYNPSASPWRIPSTIQAEDFDTGDDGVAYRDAEVTNLLGAYRDQEGGEIEACTDEGGGYNLLWDHADEWVEYTIETEFASSFVFQARVAAEAEGGLLGLSLDGADLTDPLPCPNTGGSQQWTTLTVKDLKVTAGIHVLRLHWDSPVIGRLNWFRFVDEAADVTRPSDVTARVDPPDSGQPVPGSTAAEAIDDRLTTRFLTPPGGGLWITPASGHALISAITLTSSDTPPEQDPASFILYGSNDGGRTRTEIGRAFIPPFPERQWTRRFSLSHEVGFMAYELVFPNRQSPSGDEPIAVAEIELLGDDPTHDPTSPRLLYSSSPGTLELSWTGEGSLEAAERVEGPYRPIAHSPGPHSVPTTGSARFFRVRTP